MPRKTAPKVKGGRVQKKNNWSETTDAVLLAGTAVSFKRRRPGAAYRHLLRKQDQLNVHEPFSGLPEVRFRVALPR